MLCLVLGVSSCIVMTVAQVSYHLHCAVTVFPVIVDKYLGKGTLRLLSPVFLELVPTDFSLRSGSFLQQTFLWCWSKSNADFLLPSLLSLLIGMLL